jgi:hypothetical protein
VLVNKTGSSFKAPINLCAAVSQQFLESRIDIEHDLSAAMRAAGKHLVGDARVLCACNRGNPSQALRQRIEVC